MHTLDPITTPPEIVGSHGRAWRVDLDAVRRGHPGRPDATVVSWLVEAPYAHPVWHSYNLTLVHLRPMTPPVPTEFHLAGATHELWLYACNPDVSRQKLIDGQLSSIAEAWLSPCNFAAQIITMSDETAAGLMAGAVVSMVDGVLNPDTDYIRHWMHRFGDDMIRDKANAGRTRVVLDLGGPNETVLLDMPPKPGPQDMN